MTATDVPAGVSTGAQQRIGAWVAAALSRARIERIDDPDGFFADVPEAWGAWGFGESPEEALTDLEAGLAGWMTLKVVDGDDDIPVIDAIRLDP